MGHRPIRDVRIRGETAEPDDAVNAIVGAQASFHPLGEMEPVAMVGPRIEHACLVLTCAVSQRRGKSMAGWESLCDDPALGRSLEVCGRFSEGEQDDGVSRWLA